jgi:hypothetical protein
MPTDLFEARSIFFRSMAFDFEAGPFRAFCKDYLCLQTHGFDPVHHLRHLALRKPTIAVTRAHANFKSLRRESFGAWRDTLGILKSPRWNLARLFLEDWDLTMLTLSAILRADNPDIHPFRSICQLNNVGQIHATWTTIENDIFHGLSRKKYQHQGRQRPEGLQDILRQGPQRDNLPTTRTNSQPRAKRSWNKRPDQKRYQPDRNHLPKADRRIRTAGRPRLDNQQSRTIADALGLQNGLSWQQQPRLEACGLD